MANYTLTTTAQQDAILARLLIRMNAERADQKLAPYATIEAMVRAILGDAVKSWRDQQNVEDMNSVGSAYNAASVAVQATVRTALGLP